MNNFNEMDYLAMFTRLSKFRRLPSGVKEPDLKFWARDAVRDFAGARADAVQDVFDRLRLEDGPLPMYPAIRRMIVDAGDALASRLAVAAVHFTPWQEGMIAACGEHLRTPNFAATAIRVNPATGSHALVTACGWVAGQLKREWLLYEKLTTFGWLGPGRAAILPELRGKKLGLICQGETLRIWPRETGATND